jgi:outer membrane protein TolC
MPVPFAVSKRPGAAGRALWFHIALLASQAQPAFALTFEAALKQAEALAPALTARSRSVEASALLQAQAAELPDPKLSIGIDNLPIEGGDQFSVARDFMTMRRVGWMQDVPNADKRRSRADVARALTEREAALLAVERANVRGETAQAWLARYYAERKLEAFAALAEENRLLAKATEARVAHGPVLAADAVLVRQEQAQLAERREEIERDVARAQAALRRWVGAHAEGRLEGGPPVLAIDPIDVRRRLDRIVALAPFTPNASVAAAQAREAEAAKKGDWGWGVSYSKRGSAYSDMVSVQFVFELPIAQARRQDPLVQSKMKEVERIEAERADAVRRYAEEVERQLVVIANLEQKLARARSTLIPLIEQRVVLLLASYEAGRTELAPVLAARRDRAEQALRQVELEGELQSARARLAFLFEEPHR